MAAKDKDGVITGVYKVNLHCPQCAHKIKKPLLRSQGVQSVDVDFEKGEIEVKGWIDLTNIHKLIEKSSNKKVEVISPAVQKNKEKRTREITKERISTSTTTMKVHIHCRQCERDLRKKLLKHEDIYSVKTDSTAQTVTVRGRFESGKLVSYFREKVYKSAEIVTFKQEQVKPTESKERDDSPHFIPYVYAPQLFSDENPNACAVL